MTSVCVCACVRGQNDAGGNHYGSYQDTAESRPPSILITCSIHCRSMLRERALKMEKVDGKHRPKVLDKKCFFNLHASMFFSGQYKIRYVTKAVIRSVSYFYFIP